MKTAPEPQYDYALSRRDLVGSLELHHPPSFLVKSEEKLSEKSSDTCPRQSYLPKNMAIGINWILRLVVGGTFVLAGVLKIANPAKFALAVDNYGFVPHELTNLVAILLPWIEVVAGALVLAGIWLRASALVITSLTVLFAVVIVSALAQGLNIECGCFGTIGGKHIGLVNLAIDTTLFCLAALLAWRIGGSSEPNNFSGKPVRGTLLHHLRLH